VTGVSLVVYADSICGLDFGAELANYGKYSGTNTKPNWRGWVSQPTEPTQAEDHAVADLTPETRSIVYGGHVEFRRMCKRARPSVKFNLSLLRLQPLHHAALGH
jgi:hypothetical protein